MNKNRVSPLQYSNARAETWLKANLFTLFTYKLLVCLFTYFSPRWSGMRSMNAVTVPVSDFKYTLSKAYTLCIAKLSPVFSQLFFFFFLSFFIPYTQESISVRYNALKLYNLVSSTTFDNLNFKLCRLLRQRFFRKEKNRKRKKNFNVYLVLLFCILFFRDNIKKNKRYLFLYLLFLYYICNKEIINKEIER